METKRVLVTGANGYIGTHVVRELLARGFEVVASDVRCGNYGEKAAFVEADIFDPSVDLYALAGEPDTLIHLAWRDGFRHQAKTHIRDLPLHVDFLERMMDSGVKNLSVMGSMHEIGYWEGAISADTPANPMSNYGIAKNALRQILTMMAREKQVCLHWLRGFYIYGDDERNNSIFTKLLQAAREGKETFPFTTGKNLYDFLSIDELAVQIAAAATQTKYNGVIQCCSGKPVSLADMVERFIREHALQIRLAYGAFPDRAYDSPGVWGDATVIRAILREREESDI